jgi:Phage minor capsid protein 2
MLFPPEPDYEYDVRKLVGYYEKAIDEILRDLERMDLTNFRRAQAVATLASINEILKELDGNAREWSEVYITKAATDGVVYTLLALDLASSVAEAQAIVKFNRINKEFVKAAVADTQADLLAVTTNVERKVRVAVRQVTAQVMRNNLPQGINATATLKRDILAGLRETLGESVTKSFVYADGRRFHPADYVDTLVRTKMMQAHKEATINEAVSRNALYGVISRHNAKDACRGWEGKIVKLDPSADGDFPYIGNLPRRDIFHPRCRHVVSPFRRVDRLPDDIKRLNNI